MDLITSHNVAEKLILLHVACNVAVVSQSPLIQLSVHVSVAINITESLKMIYIRHNLVYTLTKIIHNKTFYYFIYM